MVLDLNSRFHSVRESVSGDGNRMGHFYEGSCRTTNTPKAELFSTAPRKTDEAATQCAFRDLKFSKGCFQRAPDMAMMFA